MAELRGGHRDQASGSRVQAVKRLFLFKRFVLSWSTLKPARLAERCGCGGGWRPLKPGRNPSVCSEELGKEAPGGGTASGESRAEASRRRSAPQFACESAHIPCSPRAGNAQNGGPSPPKPNQEATSPPSQRVACRSRLCKPGVL